MTYLRQYMDGARSAALARARIRKAGYVFGYEKVWSGSEEQVCRLFWPNVYEIRRLLRARSKGAVKRNAVSSASPKRPTPGPRLSFLG